MVNLYLTQDIIGSKSGGGFITGLEYDFLQRFKAEEKIYPIDGNIVSIAEDPFENDRRFLAAVNQFVKEFGPPSICHIYAGTFTETVKYLKSIGVKVSYTVAAHDRKISVEEFGKMGMQYPFRHISDDELFKKYNEGCCLADVVICPSLNSKKFMEENGCRNVWIIPHPVKPYLGSCKSPNKFTVGYLGAGGPDKGIYYLLEAWKLLDIQNGLLLIAGNNINAVKYYWIKTGGRNIELTGFIDNVDDFFSRITVYVQPSVTEGFGIEILEAMDRGKPVIASTGAGAADCVESSFGAVVPIRHSQSIADEINKYYGNPALIEEAYAPARHSATNYYPEKIENNYYRIWGNL